MKDRHAHYPRWQRCRIGTEGRGGVVMTPRIAFVEIPLDWWEILPHNLHAAGTLCSMQDAE